MKHSIAIPLTILAVGLTACSTTPPTDSSPTPAPATPAAPAPADVSGTWAVEATVEAELFSGTFHLEQDDDGDVEGTFQVTRPVTFTGPVTGSLSGHRLRFSATYDLNPASGCSGEVDGSGTLDDDGEQISGDLTITECGQTVPGGFTMYRSVPRPQ